MILFVCFCLKGWGVLLRNNDRDQAYLATSEEVHLAGGHLQNVIIGSMAMPVRYCCRLLKISQTNSIDITLISMVSAQLSA